MKEQIYIASITLVSAIMTLIVKEIFDLIREHNKMKLENQKELLFKKEPKAEEILKAIRIYRDIFGDKLIQVQYRRIDWSKMTSEYMEQKFKGLKEQMAINLYLYFPNIEDEYHKYAKHLQFLNDEFSKIFKKGTIDKTDSKNLIKKYKDYLKYDGKFASGVVKEIRELSKKLN